MRKRRPRKKPTSVFDLPQPPVRIWTIHRKELVVVGILEKLLTIEDARLYYGIEKEELISWIYFYRKEGVDGLQTSHIQRYRTLQEQKHPGLVTTDPVPPAKRVALWAANTEVRLGALVLVYKRHGRKNEVLYNDEELPLRASSIEILALLIKKRGKVVTKLEILKHLYGKEFARYHRKSIDVWVNHLRDAFEKADPSLSRDSMIVSIWGRGYALSPELMKKAQKSRA